MQTKMEENIECAVLNTEERKIFADRWRKSRDFYGDATSFLKDGLGLDKPPKEARGYYQRFLRKLENFKEEFAFPLSYVKPVEDIAKMYEGGNRGPGVEFLRIRTRAPVHSNV